MTSIEDYISETKYTATILLSAIWEDYKRIDELKAKIHSQGLSVAQEYNSARAMQMYSEDPDDVMAGVGRYWDNYFGPDKELFHKNEELQKLTTQLAARELSINQLSGSLLDHAKKGLSLIYGNPKIWPSGKAIGTQNLSIIIVAARNQSAHIDEAIKNGKFNNPDITKCFNLLEKEIDPIFKDFLSRDLSFDLIKHLGWKDFDSYVSDLVSVK